MGGRDSTLGTCRASGTSLNSWTAVIEKYTVIEKYSGSALDTEEQNRHNSLKLQAIISTLAQFVSFPYNSY